MFARSSVAGCGKMDMIAEEDMIKTNGFQPLLKQENDFIQM